MEWPYSPYSSEWPSACPIKRPADEALVSDDDAQRELEGSSKRQCMGQTLTPQESTVQEGSSSFFQPGGFTALPAADPSLTPDVSVAQPANGWSEPACNGGLEAWSTPTFLYALGSNTALDSIDTTMLGSQQWQQSSISTTPSTPDVGSHFGWDWFSGASPGQHLASDPNLAFNDGLVPTADYGLFDDNDSGAQPAWTFPAIIQAHQAEDQVMFVGEVVDVQFEDANAGFGFGMNGVGSNYGDVAYLDSSLASDVDKSSVVDDGPGTEATAGLAPLPPLNDCASAEKGSAPDPIFDTCFGLVLVDDLQLHKKSAESNLINEVSLELCSPLIIIRDVQSKAYRGFVKQGCAEPLSKLVTDRAIKLSASLKSPGTLEVLVYGCRDTANAAGEMLLEHDCFLQQPDSFDNSMTYFNPQYLARKDNDGVPMWEHVEVKEGERIRAMDLSVSKRSQVAEVLDSASGPTVFRRAQVSEMLKTTLREHQLKALAMMVEKESGVLRDVEFPPIWFEEKDLNAAGVSADLRFFNTITGTRVRRKPKLCLGGLLADDMGLGKTLTTLALIAGSVARNDNQRPTATQATLIIAPLSTLTAWQEQIERHFKENSLQFTVYHGPQRQKDAGVLSSFDVVLTTYDTIRTEHVQQLGPSGKEHGVIQSIVWHRVVLDEAHVVQNRSSKRFQAVYALQARHRWCLTGTPIQNRLEDLGSLVEFLRVNPFDSPAAFKTVFLNPINRQDPVGWERLRTLVRGISLRRTKAALKGEIALLAPEEVTCQVFLDKEERRVYDLVKRRFALAIKSGRENMNAFGLILRLRQICNHGVDLLPTSLVEWVKLASQSGFRAPPPVEICESCGGVLQKADEIGLNDLSCEHQICQTCRLEAKEENLDGALDPACPSCRTMMQDRHHEQDSPLPRDPERYRPSSKVRALLRNLDEDKRLATAAGLLSGKSVVFSAWTGMLDLIGKALSAKGITFQRIDGTKSFGQRCDALWDFRNNGSCNVLLASLGSAAVGLDLTMATRVHLVEPGWNPALERQALDRVHRLGQTRQVKQIRYIVEGADSMERYMLQRQQWKMALVEASVGDSSDPGRKIEDVLKDMSRVLGTD